MESLYAELEAGVEEHLAGAGFTGESVLIERAADCRYGGQGYELRVDVPSGAIDEA